MSTRDVGGKERWGTWEELVLACAVKRHGTKSWDFVAMEVQTRTSSSSRFLLSADDCRAKYRDLWRRFRNGKARKEDEAEEKGEEEGGDEGGCEKERRIPWLEELRKIRVDELRREVERYDVSIVKFVGLRPFWFPSVRDLIRSVVVRISSGVIFLSRRPLLSFRLFAFLFCFLRSTPYDERSPHGINDLGFLRSSLQLKLEKLKEDRERSVPEAENGQKDLDPVKEDNREQLLRSEGEGTDRNDGEEETKGGTIKGTDPEAKPSEPNQRNDDLNHDNRSFSESNSTEGKPQARAPEPAMTGGAQARKADPAAEGMREERPAGRPPSPSESYNGSSETIGKDPAGRQLLRKGREADLGDVYSATKDPTGGEIGGAGRSNTESKDGSGEVEDAKESSEELSSIRLSKKKRRKGGESCSSGDDDERASDGVSAGDSPRMKSIRTVAGEVGHLADLLDAVRSHRYGRVFERRLDSQDTMYYRSLIRKHVDLEAVSTRIGEGHYCSPQELFRDLLLLFNNAIVFYPKNSPETTAAGHLRDLVTRELMVPNKAQKAEHKEDTSPSSDTKGQPRSGSNNPVLQSSKSGNSVAPVVVSRKRSTLSAPHPEAAKQPNVEPESVTREEPERPGCTEGKGADNESRKRPLKGSRTNKSRASMMASKNAPNSSIHENANRGSNQGRSLTASTTTASKGALNVTGGEKMELPSKKRSAAAANFLNRMKRTSGGPTTTTSAAMTSTATNLLETLRESGGGNGGRGGDQRKGGRDGRKESGPRQTGGKQNTQVAAAPKRGVGRPPKKGVSSGRQRAKEVEAQIVPPAPPPSRLGRKRARR